MKKKHKALIAVLLIAVLGVIAYFCTPLKDYINDLTNKQNTQETPKDEPDTPDTPDEPNTPDIPDAPNITPKKQYTLNIIEDTYVDWALTVNGETITTGSSVLEGDEIAGRVISITSGYKIGSFLINDTEHVSILDELGYFTYTVPNFDTDTLSMTAVTVKDVSSRVVSGTGNVRITKTYTDEEYSVYQISKSYMYVGQNVHCEYTIRENKVFNNSVIVNNEQIEYTLTDNVLTFDFIVPAEDFSIEISLSDAEKYNVEDIIGTYTFKDNSFAYEGTLILNDDMTYTLTYNNENYTGTYKFLSDINGITAKLYNSVGIFAGDFSYDFVNDNGTLSLEHLAVVSFTMYKA